MYIYFIINSVASYMFRPAVAAIFIEVCPEGYITCDVKTMYIYEMLIIIHTS